MVVCGVAVFTAFETSRAANFFGPTAYLQSTDIPANFYASGHALALEDFEDGTLSFGITASSGGVTGPGGNTDSVDADDGNVDGSGTLGKSWFRTDQGNMATLTFTFQAPLPTAAGIVWTDGASGHNTVFEAFGSGMVSLGTLGPFNISDAVTSGQTAEDRFFGVIDFNGVLAVRVTNSGVFGGLEVDHVQYGIAWDPSVLRGDYNDDDKVDAADYATWRKNEGAPAGTLPNDIDGGTIGQPQYNTWRAYFGEPTAGSAASIPEPSSGLLCLAAIFATLMLRSRSRS
jgi:hypothetical protein